jgi:hypothetical protein
MSKSQSTATATIKLGQIASARSGDKGNHANLGVIAFTEPGFKYLQQELTAERIKQFFAGLGITRAVRYELPNIWGFNFLLYDALAGGASQSLRIDTQGKLIGTAALEIELPMPDGIDGMIEK